MKMIERTIYERETNALSFWMAGDIIHLFPEVVHQYASGWRKVEWVAYVIISLLSYDNVAYYVRVVLVSSAPGERWHNTSLYINYTRRYHDRRALPRHFLTRRVHFLARPRRLIRTLTFNARLVPVCTRANRATVFSTSGSYLY